MAAFLRAVELGADAVELDVHATGDGVVVVHHDPVVQKPLPGDARTLPIDTATLAELRGLQPGSSKGIPTLAEVLEAMPSHVTVYVEIKGAAIEAAVIEAIRRSPAAGRCAVHSFDHRAVKRARADAPEIPAGLLMASSRLVDPAALLATAGARDLWMHWEWVDAPLVADVHAAGGRVIAWTPVARHDIDALVRHGADGICVNDVASLREQLGSIT